MCKCIAVSVSIFTEPKTAAQFRSEKFKPVRLSTFTKDRAADQLQSAAAGCFRVTQLEQPRPRSPAVQADAPAFLSGKPG